MNIYQELNSRYERTLFKCPFFVKKTAWYQILNLHKCIVKKHWLTYNLITIILNTPVNCSMIERIYMSYEQFVQEVETKLQEKVGDNRKVYVHTAIKNNGRIRKGITFVEKGINISPTIYLEEYYERFVIGGCVDTIIDQILRLYENVRAPQSLECDFINEYKMVKDKIVIRLVNKNANQIILKDIPHLLFMDLAIVFHILVELDGQGERMATMLIKNEYIEAWDVTVDELYKTAVCNTEKLLPSEMSSMFMLIEEILPEWEKSEVPEDEDFMYVLSNDRKSFGACTILYPDRLEMIGLFLKENYYILPSSVHEVIILPESKAVGREELMQIVCEINHTQVPEEEILSDNVYYYDVKEKKLFM